MKHIAASQIMQHLTKNNILYNHQSGFNSKVSSEMQLIEFTKDMLRGIKDGKQSDVVMMDFAKAFNKVSHTKLLHKLQMYGMYTETRGWFRSFLCGRTQHVVAGEETSEEMEITLGVPQGSVLGPNFFLVYINNMAKYTKHVTVRLFNAVPSCEMPFYQNNQQEDNP